MLSISELLGSIALEMPYKGKRLSMILLLPTQDYSLKELEDSIKKVDDLNSLLKFNAARKVKVELTLPKFKLESEIDLNEPLKALGMQDMFSESKADFSVMTGGPKKPICVTSDAKSLH